MSGGSLIEMEEMRMLSSDSVGCCSGVFSMGAAVDVCSSGDTVGVSSTVSPSFKNELPTLVPLYNCERDELDISSEDIISIERPSSEEYDRLLLLFSARAETGNNEKAITKHKKRERLERIIRFITAPSLFIVIIENFIAVGCILTLIHMVFKLANQQEFICSADVPLTPTIVMDHPVI